MVMQTDSKQYQKLLKGGSVLQSLRSAKGGGRGCFIAGLSLLICALVLVLVFILLGVPEAGGIFLFLFGIPSIPLLLIGALLMIKRKSSYLKFYKKETGFSDEELHQVDEELASPNIHIIGFEKEGSVTKHQSIACFITTHYFVTEGYYVRRIEDMLAIAYTDRMPWVDSVVFGLVCLSKKDTEAHFMTFATPSEKKQGLCMEIIEELHLRNPKIVRGQKIQCDGRQYDLIKESKEILRLSLEGHTLEAKV